VKTIAACIATAAVTATAAFAGGVTKIYQGGVANFVGKRTTCQSVSKRVACLVYYDRFEAKYNVSLARSCITVSKYAYGGAAQRLLWRRREC
jgi:hypothetical protein